MRDNSSFKRKFEKLNKKILNVKDIDAGILGGIHEKYWINCGAKQYLFKYNQSEKDYSDFGEVFTSFICYVLGLKCVKSSFEEDFFEYEGKKKHGVLIESYRTKNVKESFSLSSLLEKYKRRCVSNYGYTAEEAFSVAKEFCLDNNIILDENLEQELKEMALMDYLLTQCDRHAKNIEFLVLEKEGIKVLKLAPMFDNGFCLHLHNSTKENIKTLQKHLIKKYIEVGLTHDNPKPKFYIEKTETLFDEGECIVSDLATELLENKRLMDVYNNFCQLDINEEINFVASMKEGSIPEINKQLINLSIKNRIRLLNNELLRQQFIDEKFEQVEE